jgi:hypothetical protein
MAQNQYDTNYNSILAMVNDKCATQHLVSLLIEGLSIHFFVVPIQDNAVSVNGD